MYIMYNFIYFIYVISINTYMQVKYRFLLKLTAGLFGRGPKFVTKPDVSAVPLTAIFSGNESTLTWDDAR